MERLVLTPQETANLLGISRSKAYELLAAGELPSVRIGRAVRVPVEGLHRWIDKNTGGREHPAGDHPTGRKPAIGQ